MDTLAQCDALSPAGLGISKAIDPRDVVSYRRSLAPSGRCFRVITEPVGAVENLLAKNCKIHSAIQEGVGELPTW